MVDTSYAATQLCSPTAWQMQQLSTAYGLHLLGIQKAYFFPCIRAWYSSTDTN